MTEPTTDDLTSRYTFSDDRSTRYLASVSAPNVHLIVERGLSVTKANRKKFDRQTIFLDGVYTDAPFFDNERRQYSLDHHAGCVRLFTLATCEQAVVMLLQGLPIDDGEWTLWINDPDLDAVVAAWVLLNHTELLRENRALLKTVIPFVRVEGVIDAHGYDLVELTGYSADRCNESEALIDHLRSDEKRYKAAGAWNSIDFMHYAKSLLDELDRKLLPSDILERLIDITEIDRLCFQNGKIAVLCESQDGIYTAEARLKQRYDKQLALIILRVDANHYTLRLVDQFMPKNLTHLYRALNRQDPNVTNGGDKEQQWGGSSEIGGSPRKTGTALTVEQLLRIIHETYSDTGWFKNFLRQIK